MNNKTLEQKLAAAKEYLGNKWVLHPQSVYDVPWRNGAFVLKKLMKQEEQ